MLAGPAEPTARETSSKATPSALTPPAPAPEPALEMEGTDPGMQRGRRPRHRRTTRVYLGAYAVVAALGWVLAAEQLVQSYHATLTDIRAEATDLAHLAAEHARLTLGAAEVGIAMLADRMTTSDWWVLAAPGTTAAEQVVELTRHVAQLERTLPVPASYFVLDRDGRIRVWGQSSPPPDVSLADRSYFRRHRALADPDLVVGNVVESGIFGHPVLTVTRRIDTPGGDFAGVVGAAVDPTVFGAFHRSLNLGTDGVVLLLDRDGAVLSRHAADTLTAGSKLEPQPQLAAGTEPEPAPRHLTSAVDGVERLYALAPLRDTSVVAVAGVAMVEAMAPWWRDTLMKLGIGGILFVLLTGAVIALTRQVHAIAAANRRLRDNQARLNSFFNAAFEGIVLSEKGLIRDVNTALLTMLGYSPEQMIGQPVISFVHPDDAARVFRAMRISDPAPYEIRIVAAGGRLIDAEVRGRPHPDDHDVRVAAVRDISHLKAQERQLQEAIQGLERSNRDLEQFAYVASHDLQEPLRTVSSYVGLLQRRYGDVLADEGKEFVRYAVDGAKRMQTLIHDLLDYSRVGSRSGPLEPAPVRPLVEAAVHNLSTAIRESHATIEIGTLPVAAVDRAQITRLFQNLLSNAIKYRDPATPPHVAISAEADHGAWRFTVRDNGIGIAPQYAEQVFMIFQRLHGPGTYEGTGIGLAVARRIVEGHGGRIWVDTEQSGPGTAVHFTLPAAKP